MLTIVIGFVLTVLCVFIAAQMNSEGAEKFFIGIGVCISLLAIVVGFLTSLSGYKDWELVQLLVELVLSMFLFQLIALIPIDMRLIQNLVLKHPKNTKQEPWLVEMFKKLKTQIVKFLLYGNTTGKANHQYGHLLYVLVNVNTYSTFPREQFQKT